MKENVRALAAQIILEVIEQQRSLPVVISEKIPDHYEQRPLLFELCYGTLRWYHRLRALAFELLLKPLPQKNQDLMCLLMVGLHQLVNMKVPEYAAVSETVQGASALGQNWAKALINKTLRRFIEERETLLEKVNQQDEARFVHPGWFIEKVRKAWPQKWESILAANTLRAPLTLRVNQQKNSRDEYQVLLKKYVVHAEVFMEPNTALRLEKPMSIENIPGFMDGKVSVQDQAGQFVPSLLDLQPGHRVLDACAAPGSKSSHLLETQPGLARLVSVDKDPERLPMIKQNIERLQLPHDHFNLILADVSHTKQWWSGDLFDRILLDVPCSCSGVIRRHPDIKVLRKEEDIAQYAEQQLHLLKALWPLLEKKGLLLYSTCSILPEENEQLITKFLSNEATATAVPITLPVGEKQTYGWQLLPKVEGPDGFYYCLLQKT